MNDWIRAVITQLYNGGVDAMRGFPSQRQPVTVQPTAAVNLAHMDRTCRKVLVTVASPSQQGAALCEDTAIRCFEILSQIGQVQIDGPCRYDADSDLFSLSLTVETAVE